MNLNKEFRTLVVPIIKGAPILIVILVIAILIARRLILYSNPVYQTDAAVKIDNRDYGIGSFTLFDGESGPKQSMSSAFLTEIEIFKSRMIKEKTFEKLDFDISYFRVGQLRTAEIYDHSPFKITHTLKNKALYEEKIPIIYQGNDQFGYQIGGTDEEPIFDIIEFDKSYSNDDFEIIVRKNKQFWETKLDALQEGDKFAFEIISHNQLLETINSSNLFVKPVDKEIAIMKVYYKHEVPEKAALVVNTMVDTYIEMAKNSKANVANNTITFIDNQVQDVEKKLKNAEGQLALYKRSNNLVDTRLETDATLKELTALDLQNVGLDLQNVELNTIYDLLLSENDISDFSPNFQSITDAVFEDAFIKLKALEIQHKDLQNKYSPTSAEVQTIQLKINNLNSFLVETIVKKQNSLSARRVELKNKIEGLQNKLKQYPDKQRKIAELQREVSLNAQTYTFLVEKRMELGIAQSSTFSFHRVIDHAPIPIEPISPNGALIIGLSVFIALLIGLVIIYIWHYFTNTIESKEELKDIAPLPILSTISQVKESHQDAIEPFLNLFTNINILQRNRAKTANKGNTNQQIGFTDTQKPIFIAISSIMPNEGRTFMTVGLGRTMAHFGKKVLLLDLDKRKPKLHKALGIENGTGIGSILRDEAIVQECVLPSGYENMDIIPAGNLEEIPDEFVFSPKSIAIIDEMKQYYDVIIADMPPTAVVLESVAMMHESDINLYSIQAYKSRARFVKHIPTFVEEYKVPNLYLVLNGMRSSSGFYATSYRMGFRRRLINLLSGSLNKGRM